MDPLPYYRWYWRDFRADLQVQEMSWQARGLYRALLDECWASGSIPDGADPANAAAMQRITGAPHDIIATWWDQIRPHFRRRGRKLINPRIERERKKAMQAHAAKVDGGKRGASKRWGGDDRSPMADPKLNIASSNRTKQSSSRRRSLGPETGPRSPVSIGELEPLRAWVENNKPPGIAS